MARALWPVVDLVAQRHPRWPLRYRPLLRTCNSSSNNTCNTSSNTSSNNSSSNRVVVVGLTAR